MRRIRLIILAAPIMVLLSFNGYAVSSQQQSPTDLALEVTYDKSRPPTYQTILGPDAKHASAWYALFGHIPSWQPPAGSLPVRAVYIVPRLEGDSVRVAVSVYLGVRFHEKEVPVGNYLIRENEEIGTGELTQFGVEPFQIKLVRVLALSTAIPQVVNKTQSIAVTGVEANNSTFPSYKLRLRNLSGKNVLALGIYVLANGCEKSSSLPHRKEGQPIIEAGSEYEKDYELGVSAVNDAGTTNGGYVPDAPPDQEILISTAVFEDGSYEGDAKVAASFRAFVIGRKIQIGRLIPLIQDALNDKDLHGRQAVEAFKARVGALSGEVSMSVVGELRKEFPSLDENAKANLKSSIEVALNGVKFDLLKDIQEFEKAGSQSSDANAFRMWLSKKKERYEKWLARL